MRIPKHYRVLPILLVAACMSSGSTTKTPVFPAVTTDQKTKQESYLFTDSLHDIRFWVSTHMDMKAGPVCRVDAVDMSIKGSKDMIQHLVLDNMIVLCPMPDGHFQSVELADFDFDGRKDFRIMRMAADLSHPAFNYWLFDPTKNGFLASRMLDSIQDPQFDYERRMSSSQWYEGPGHRGGSTFKTINGKITMVSNMEKFTEGDHERWVIWGMKDGKLQPISEKIHPLPKD